MRGEIILGGRFIYRWKANPLSNEQNEEIVMPNHCRCRLTISGNGLQNCVDSIRGEEKAISFNSIVPMPEVVRKTESSSTADWGLIILGLPPDPEVYSYPWVKETGVK